METPVMATPEPNLLSLIFSTAGATIFICVTVIMVSIVIYLLSRRYPKISLQYKDSKLELRRDDFRVETKPSEIGASASPSEKPALVEKEAVEPISVVIEEEKPRPGIFDLAPAVERQDITRINEIFDEFKINPPFGGDTPYELEVWRNSELLRAGSSAAFVDLERIERQNTDGTDASEALVRYYLKIGAYQQASTHIQIFISRANTDERLSTATL
jgi:hypothetical protein